MAELKQFTKLLKMMSLLTSVTRRTSAEYAALLAVDKSTINRYLQTLDSIGYPIQRNKQHQVYIDRNNWKKYIHVAFSEEDAQTLTELVKGAKLTQQD